MKKIKPIINTEAYPVQYSDLTMKYFNIKELYRKTNESEKLKSIINKKIPELSEYYDLIFSRMTFDNIQDFLNFYIEKRAQKLPDISHYINNQTIKKFDVDITAKIKRDR